ncbi:LysR family transcriptional regulator [Devosia sp. LjRoot16]|uniref:LysR family transcriptional regulator n=1 Tax=Devosia sp. LjRoot16 TaxID=3342271 RepID=UPI003ED0A022
MLHEIDLSRIDLNLLVLFEVVLDELNVGRAALRLNLSPSAVSHGLGRLRSQLNDPLFLKTPKGVVATERALALAEPVADILARVRRVMATAEPFDPLTSRRRFIIGSPDGSAIVPLPMLLADLAAKGPGIDIGTRQLMPDPAQLRPWDPVFEELDARRVDIAAVTFGEVPSRFVARTLYTDEFVVVARKGHPFLAEPTLDAYCAANHVVVSGRADPASYTGEVLASLGRSRRVQLTVPLFVVALATIAESDLIGSMPKRLVASLSDRFGLASAPLPFDHGRPSQVSLVVPRVALMDAGLAWLVGRIEQLVMETVVV